jgi:quercetin dioxygenase-like cupin family protein/DNA-binding Xre family transcriptional regulator
VSSRPAEKLEGDEPGRRGGGLGTALKEARLARGDSLAQVAAATGISKSSLSLIENGRSDVTIGRLVRLAEHYGKHVGDFLPARTPVDPIVTRRTERRLIFSRTEKLDVHLLTPEADHKMNAIVVVFKPGGGSADFAKHDGEEFVVVLEGRVLLELKGSTPVVLERGDSAYYESDRPHRWSNAGDGLARVLSVSTPPGS